MSDDKEYEDLEALLKAPGWLRFYNAMTKQWREEYDMHVNKAANVTDDALALSQLRQVVAAKKAVLAAIEYPKERLRQIDQAAASRVKDVAVPWGRRGAL